MSNILLTNFLDASRSLGPVPNSATPESVRDWFVAEYLAKRAGGFNYDPASFATYQLFRGAATKEQAISFCETTGNPKGRPQNADAIRTVADYALENISRCHKTGFVALQVGRAEGQSVYVGIQAPFLRVRERQGRVVVHGYRLSHRPVEQEIDVACAIALSHLARDDYSEADIEYLYAGPGPDGKRMFRSILGRDRALPSREELDDLMSIYVRGIALLLRDGASPQPPSFRGYQIYSKEDGMMF
ncbi:MAG: hypothetical protein JWN11_1418 [Hyphomicrobiales bacterium]|nr:hypothetical protein [Hyphomicrobiales bacterium]